MVIVSEFTNTGYADKEIYVEILTNILLFLLGWCVGVFIFRISMAVGNYVCMKCNKNDFICITKYIRIATHINSQPLAIVSQMWYN